MTEKKSHSEPGKNTKGSAKSARPTPQPTPATPYRGWPRAHILSRAGRLEVAQGALAPQPVTPWSLYLRRGFAVLVRSRSVGITVIVLLLAGATYAAVLYLSNTPSYVYARGVKNSGQLIDNLVSYAQQLQSAPYKSVLVDGSMQGSDIVGRYDIDLSGTENKNGDGSFSASGDVDGMPLNSDIRTVATHGNPLPDAYIKSKDLDALKPLIGVQGLPSLNQFDDKWIQVDHNLLESYLDNLMSIVDKNIDKNTPQPGPNLAQIADALTKIQAVSKQYLLTTSTDTAVFKDPVFIGSETDNGRRVNQYQVTYDNAHLAAYLQALGKALDSSQLNAWSQKVSQGKSVSQTLNLAAMGQGVQQHSGTGNTADIWIDRDAKIITKVQVNNPSANLSSVVITQGYTGGQQYPFAVTYKGKDATGANYTAAVSFVLNADTHTATVSLTNQTQAGGLRSVQDMRLSLTPSGNTIQAPGIPAGAVPLLTALGPSGLSELAQP